MNVFQQIPWRVWLPAVGGVLLLALGGGTTCYYHQKVATLRADVRAERALRDTARVKEAAAKADKEQYRQLYEFAKSLGGKPAAGATLVISRVDTTIVHDTLPTTLAVDSTRVAHVRDSTRAGVLDATLTAPPCCAPLRFTYTLTRPALRPQVGFTRVGSRVLVTATVDGDSVAIESPFYVPPALPRWERFIGVYGDPDALSAAVGTRLRVRSGAYAVVQAARRFAPNTPGVVQIGAEWRW